MIGYLYPNALVIRNRTPKGDGNMVIHASSKERYLVRRNRTPKGDGNLDVTRMICLFWVRRNRTPKGDGN